MNDSRALALIILWDVRKLGRYKFFLAMRFALFLLQVLVFGFMVAYMVSVKGPHGPIDYYKFYWCLHGGFILHVYYEGSRDR